MKEIIKGLLVFGLLTSLISCQEDFIDELPPTRLPGSFSVSNIDTLPDTLVISAVVEDNYSLGAYTLSILPVDPLVANTITPPYLTLIDTFGLGGERTAIRKEIEMLTDEVASGQYQVDFQFADAVGVENGVFVEDTTFFITVANPLPSIRTNGVFVDSTFVPLNPRDTLTLDTTYNITLSGTMKVLDSLYYLLAQVRLLKIGDSVLLRSKIEKNEIRRPRDADRSLYDLDTLSVEITPNDSLTKILSLEIIGVVEGYSNSTLYTIKVPPINNTDSL